MLFEIDYLYLKDTYGLHWQKLILHHNIPNHGYVKACEIADLENYEDIYKKCVEDLKKEYHMSTAGLVVNHDWYDYIILVDFEVNG